MALVSAVFVPPKLIKKDMGKIFIKSKELGVEAYAVTKASQ